MPIYDTNHLEHNINNGNITIVDEGGKQIPAFWAHPELGKKFPGMVLLHDWWGLTDIIRRLAGFFAQMGYYVIVPDLFEGQAAQTHKEALVLVERYKPQGYKAVHAALTVLEDHHMCNRDVAAVGLGLGGSLAFEAAINRTDLEAAIAYGGFPQNHFGSFVKTKTAILACFGGKDPYTRASDIAALRKELNESPLKEKHQVEVFGGLAHDFFSHSLTTEERAQGRKALDLTLSFMERHLRRSRPHRTEQEIM